MATLSAQFPQETILHIFSYLEFPDLSRIPLACKQWSSLRDILWNPLREELKDALYPYPPRHKKWMLRYVKSYHIAKPLLDGNEKFRLALNGSLLSLSRFQELPPCSQLSYFWRGVKRDSTLLLKLLIDKTETAAYDFAYRPAKISINEAGTLSSERDQMPPIQRLLSKKETQLLLSWTQDPLAPYNHRELLKYLSYSTHGLKDTAFSSVVKKIREHIISDCTRRQKIIKRQRASI
jgi:hypothetical protein